MALSKARALRKVDTTKVVNNAKDYATRVTAKYQDDTVAQQCLTSDLHGRLRQRRHRLVGRLLVQTHGERTQTAEVSLLQVVQVHRALAEAVNNGRCALHAW